MQHQPPEVTPPEQTPVPGGTVPSTGRVIWRALLPPILLMVVQTVVITVITAQELLGKYYNMSPEDVPLVRMEDLISLRSFYPAMLCYGCICSLLFYRMYTKLRRGLPAPAGGLNGLFTTVVLISVAGNFALLSGIQAVQNLLRTNVPTSALDALPAEDEPLLLAVLLFFTCVAAPLAEELCFRALTLNHLKARFGFWQSNIAQALLFGLIHGNWIQSAYAFLFGLFLGWIYHKTGRFSLAVAAHIAFNSSNLLLGFIPGIESLLGSTWQLAVFMCAPAAFFAVSGIIQVRRRLPR